MYILDAVKFMENFHELLVVIHERVTIPFVFTECFVQNHRTELHKPQ